jgi:catechol 2,3-dioxygenase-like lactoylglutathione lyase family enzyme
MTMVRIEPFVYDHAGVSVADLDVSRKFYSEVLGFDQVDDSFELKERGVRGMVLKNQSGARLELFERVGSRTIRVCDPIEDTALRGWFQIAFSVRNVHAVFKSVTEAGAKPVMAPLLAPDGRSMVAFIADPDGNLIEFLQRPENG